MRAPLWAWIIAGLVLLGGGGFAVYNATRGIRNNNPGNMRFNPRITWRGQIGADADGFVIFATPEDGIHALTVNLRNQQRLHALNTVADIITKYAPGNENDTAAYITDVAARMGVAPGDYINLENDATLAAMVRAVIHHENGKQPYTVAMIDAQVAAA